MSIPLFVAGAGLVILSVVDQLTAAVGGRSASPWSPSPSSAGLTTLWSGWFLIFSAAPEAVVEAASDTPAGGWARLYYAGDTIFTLGSGDLRSPPGVPGWPSIPPDEETPPPP